MTNQAGISAIVPLFNAEKFIDLVLAPLVAALERKELVEVIVVDDCSTDSSPQRVRAYPGVLLTRTPRQLGPGGARNLAATTARGDVLWFVDSDVIPESGAPAVIAECFRDPSIVAVMGSYDETPAASNFLSQYKNLVHHYYHQRAREDATTFWAGCGAVRATAFNRVGGFDVARYRFPSIEDIDLGYRLHDSGGRIVLDKRLRGKHLKEWRLKNLVHTEIFRRAIPWSTLMLERGSLTNDLNVGRGERIRAALAAATTASALAAAGSLAPPWLPAGTLALTAAANRDFIAFFHRTRGLAFAGRAFLFHQFYYLYSSAAFAYALLRHKIGRSGSP